MIAPWPADDAWSLFSPERLARVDTAGWSRFAQTFFSCELAFLQTLTHPQGELPERAALELAITGKGYDRATLVRVQTLPLSEAPALRARADEGVRAIGGAGFDVLMGRAQRVWQVRARVLDGEDTLAPALAAAVIAHALAAPVVPPGGGTVHGVRGVRVWLSERGWQG